MRGNTNGKDGVAGSIPAGAPNSLTSGNAGQLSLSTSCERAHSCWDVAGVRASPIRMRRAFDADGGRNRLGGGGRRGQPALAETSDLPGIASWRTPQPVNTGRQSVRQLKTGVGAVRDEGPAALTRPGAANVRTQVQDAEEVP